MAVSTTIILIFFIGIAFYFDITKNIIPNKLILVFLPIGFINSFFVGSTSALFNSLIAMLLAGGLMMVAYILKGLGAGDVKLMAVIGVITGVHFTLYCMFYSVLFGGLIAIVIMIISRTPLKKLIETVSAFVFSIAQKSTKPIEIYAATKATTMPFMWAVVPGVLVAYYYVYMIG